MQDVEARLMSAESTKRSLRAAYGEFMRHSSPRIITLLAASALVARLAVADWSWWDVALVAAIVALWPIQEWLIHVWILHAKPIELGPWTIDSAVPRDHRAHHRDPWDLRYVFIPHQGLAISFVVHALLWPLVLPTWGLALTAIACVFCMGLVYEWTHYLIHSRYRPRSAFYKRLWRNHRLHHCKNEHYWFGVTMTLGDTLLGTAPDHRDVETSHSCRTLES